MTILDDFEKSIIQLLLARGILEDSQLQGMLDIIKSDFEHCPSRSKSLDETFHRINENLHPISMELRSVVKSSCQACETIYNVRPKVCEVSDCGCTKFNFVYYHGIANTEDDYVATEFGNEFDPTESKFFSDILVKLLATEYEVSEAFYALRPAKWTTSQADSVIKRLHARGWLQIGGRQCWEIGNRTLLELRSFLEESLRSGAEDDGDEDSSARDRENVQRQLDELPQHKLY